MTCFLFKPTERVKKYKIVKYSSKKIYQDQIKL